MTKSALCIAVFLVAGLVVALPAWAGELEDRIQAVAAEIEKADDMFAAAKKGHLPSVEVINNLSARMRLARSLHDQAVEESQNGKPRDAAAKLEAAEFLAQKVFEMSDH